ncbi:OLC1v1013996C1 [Oldenlandia corymbosa var. corymbosa]|uniref:OLC1v1013996C1 n=1 Tax=Oldenlandia corymbosa var. corymbosa TaxID=529605 RepID=A0AAV1DZR4_OLDCO|nr:OLC1v1013996C1 [Oldenlandia corymbosa var. corymbosa]
MSSTTMIMSSSSPTSKSSASHDALGNDPLMHSSSTSSHPASFSPTTNNIVDNIMSSTKEDKPEAEADDHVNLASSEKKKNDSDGDDKYPSGEFELRELGAWRKFNAKCKMFLAWPGERVKKGSVLTMKLGGKISEKLKSRSTSNLSLPRICENFVKAAYDPRISGIYLHIDKLSCGWATAEEIRRHILDFKKSGKFIVGFLPVSRAKEYYIGCACEELYVPPSAYIYLYGLTVEASFLRGVLDKVGIEPQVERIGKYKAYGDRFTRKNMSEENREMLTALLENIYNNWIDKVSQTIGKGKEDIEKFLNEGAYKVERLKEDGWITDIKYDDEVRTMLKERLKLPKDKSLPTVGYRKYSAVRGSTLGLIGSKDKIAVIRASGSISHSGSGIVAEDIIKKIRKAKESKKFKAVIIRIDSPGGDVLASTSIWREIKVLSESKPVIASMGDMAASGGYYMAMGADVIVAENLTLTGSIGVVSAMLNHGKLYEKIGFNKEIISRGRFSELFAANQRPFRSDEAELFAKLAQNLYDQFRDNAAVSRSMPVEKMEEVAQGRVWTGNDAASRGLVDAIGGFRRCVAIAKQKANIRQDHEVTLVEMVRAPSLLKKLCGIRSFLAGANQNAKIAKRMLNLLDNLSSSDGIQARMDGILFQLLDGIDSPSPMLAMLEDYLI